MPISNVRELIQAIDASVRWGTPLRPQTLMAIRRLLTRLEDGDESQPHRARADASGAPRRPSTRSR